MAHALRLHNAVVGGSRLAGGFAGDVVGNALEISTVQGTETDARAKLQLFQHAIGTQQVTKEERFMRDRLHLSILHQIDCSGTGRASYFMLYRCQKRFACELADLRSDRLASPSNGASDDESTIEDEEGPTQDGGTSHGA